jgi:hypothetical protein
MGDPFKTQDADFRVKYLAAKMLTSLLRITYNSSMAQAMLIPENETFWI